MVGINAAGGFQPMDFKQVKRTQAFKYFELIIVILGVQCSSFRLPIYSFPGTKNMSKVIGIQSFLHHFGAAKLTAMSNNNTEALKMEPMLIQKALYAIRAINHKRRLSMLQLIHGIGRLTVSEIYDRLQVQQSVASQHLAILRREGFVHTKREGMHIYYSVNYERLRETESLCRQFTGKRTMGTESLSDQPGS